MRNDAPVKRHIGTGFPLARTHAMVQHTYPVVRLLGLMVGAAGCDGTTTASNPQPPESVQVSVSPNSATLQAGATQQFTATADGISLQSVAWSVNDVPGGNTTVGTIGTMGTFTTSGFYTAPGTVPNPSTVTVKATVLGATNAGASATVTITPGPLSSVQQIGTLNIAGAPATVLVDETRNKVYVSDVSGGTIQVFDGNTHQSLSTITGCAGVFDWVIDQVFGRIYAGCGRQATTGVLDGDGKIRVIDTGSDAITAVIDLGTTGISFFKLAIDRTRHSVWISHQRASGPQIAMIDVPTNAVSFVDTYGAGVYGSVSVNETTNKAYVVSTQYGTVQEIDGNTFAISRSLSPPYGQAVQSGINRREDKLYVKTIGGPGGRPTVCIYNMSQALPACVPIAGNDWGGIVTNETTNLVYVGVEVGDRIGVVDGASDRLVAEIPMDPATGVSGSTNQSHAVVANETTNHSFFVNRGFLLALDGPTRLTRRLAYSNASPGGGGLLAQAVAINRSNNRVYVVYDGTRVGKVAVFQDR